MGERYGFTTSFSASVFEIFSGGGSTAGSDIGGRAGDAFADTAGEGVLEPDFLWRRPICSSVKSFLLPDKTKLDTSSAYLLYRTMTGYFAGDFSFMKNEPDRAALEDMFQAVSATRSWEALREDPGDGGFMFGAPELARTISGALKDPNVHSGSSYAWCMREMQFIARNGWNTYIKNACVSQTQKKAHDESPVQ
jgi:hypothetical protein